MNEIVLPTSASMQVEPRVNVRRKTGRLIGQTVASGAIKAYAPTVEKQRLLALWKEEVGRQFPALVAAQLNAATGITHMQARDQDGRWTTVTDPEEMNERLNAGEQCYRLTAVAPSAPILKDIMDRLFGQSRQMIDVEVNALPSGMTDAELAADLAGLLQRLTTVPEEADVIDMTVTTDEHVTPKAL